MRRELKKRGVEETRKVVVLRKEQTRNADVVGRQYDNYDVDRNRKLTYDYVPFRDPGDRGT